MFIGLNPSTADENNDDPTVRRCIRYAFDWGYGGLCMANIFAFRATDPVEMKRAADPIGPENDKYLIELSEGAGIVVIAWGNHGSFHDRGNQVLKLLDDFFYLGLTKSKQPKHPLYLRKDLKPINGSGK